MSLWNDVTTGPLAEVPETWLARTPFRGRKAASLPVMPRVWRSVELAEIQRVVVSSHAFAHHLASAAAERGLAAYAYIHTPARYIWAPEVESRAGTRAARLGRSVLRRSDQKAVRDSVDYAANSEYIRDRIRKSWGVDARVIYPPVNTGRIQNVATWKNAPELQESKLQRFFELDCFILGASRLVTYKRLDLAIRVGELLDMPVVIAGSGPDEARLRERAKASSVPVHFTGRTTDEELYCLYQEASLFTFLAVEDFGIMPVEAVAAGTPVLVNALGGASETVSLLKAGQMVDPESDEELRSAATVAITTDMDRPRREVSQFSHDSFAASFLRWVGEIPSSGDILV